MKNEIGNKYGKLTVISKSNKTDSSRNIYWLCQCECGNTTIAQGTKLRNGSRVSCGCQRKEKLANIAEEKNFIDETGNIYGKLKVISIHHKDEKQGYYWNCYCDCGNKCIVRGSQLRAGKTNSCGCISSKGEMIISKWLRDKNIDFISQKTFETCRFPDTNALARFDFYISKKNILIEYDGEQHFQIKENKVFTKEKLTKIKEHDAYKDNWCKENNIKLYRISYKDDLENKLLEIFN